MTLKWKIALGAIAIGLAALWHRNIVKKERARAIDSERLRQKKAA
jgi:hypothetical protein